MKREVVTRHGRTFTVTVNNTVQMRKRQPRAVEFVKIPAVWTIKLRGQHGRVYDMAHHLLLLNFKSYKRGFKLTNVAMGCLEMDRRVKYRTLNKLEKLGLISVDRRPGKSPLITLLL